MSVSEQFRTLIRESGVSRYRLAKESAGRLHQSELASFLAGRSRLGLAKLDIVAELLGGLDQRDAAVSRTGSIVQAGFLVGWALGGGFSLSRACERAPAAPAQRLAG